MIEIHQFEEVVQIKMSRELGGKPLYWVAAYLVDGLLIDTGCKHTAGELHKFLEDKTLKLVVNTHYHEDHIGANYLLKKKFGVEIRAHRESVPLINQVPQLYPYQEMVWGYPEPTEVNCLPEKIVTDHLRFEVVETPGHCKGHIALVEPEKGWCFSGDLFVSERPKVIRPEENITEIMRSMKKLVDLKTDRLILLTSMGNVVQDGRRALQSCIAYLQDMSQSAKQLEKKGLSIETIRDELFERESSLAGFTDGQFSSENLIRAVLRESMNHSK
jgi:glyoxylase-like metal-dependent hydrolase (beta-lactamase superfamily II)